MSPASRTALVALAAAALVGIGLFRMVTGMTAFAGGDPSLTLLLSGLVAAALGAAVWRWHRHRTGGGDR